MSRLSTSSGSLSRCLALFVLCTSSLLFGQGTTSIRGTVTDAQGGVIPDALVTLKQVDTGAVRTAPTKDSGQYEFSALSPGNYSVSFEKTGFAKIELVGLKLLVDSPVSKDVQMEVASTSRAVVVVEESTAPINKEDASLGNAFQEKQVQELPIQTRNAVQLLSLQPGVTQNGEVMGARRDQNNITLDGVDSNDNQNPLSALNGNSSGGAPSPTASSQAALNSTSSTGFNSALPVPLDSVMEFRVTVAGEGAGAGHSSGGQVSLITRGGTNQFHGSAYEYNRNTAYTANNWFSNRAGVPRAQLVRNQFGASLGGPVKKDRIFFFLNYERRIDSSQTLQTRTVPSETLKQGLLRFGLNNGTTATLTPAQIRQIDPLKAGVSPYMLSYLSQFPVGNRPDLGSDGGLNFSGYVFNAPIKVDYRTYVGRFDWNIDQASKHVISFRGTLSNFQQTLTPQQFPGQSEAQQTFSDNRGFSTRYTALLTPTLVNVANFGLTRIGYQNTGAIGTGITFGGISSANNLNRPSTRINPVYNLSDALTWSKGNHTITGGINFLFYDNGLNDYANSYPNYSFSRGQLLSLGQDIYPVALATAAGGNNSLKLSNSTAVTNGLGDLLGLVNYYTVTYQFQKNGTAIPLGQPLSTDFISRTYEFFLQDSWKVSPKLTVNYGIHYQNMTPPYEASGLQVSSTPGLDVYFGGRAYAQSIGLPANQLPNNDLLTYNLNGPVNGKASWYKRDNNNWAPRLSVAYSPETNTVIRAGAAVLYDQYGNDIATNFASRGSAGLSTALGPPASYNFTTSARIGASGLLPSIVPAPTGGLPYTPPLNRAIAGTVYGISPSIVAPYSYVFNFNVSHQFAGNYIVDLGYVGRLSRKNLVQVDVSNPLIYFKDPKSGQTLTDNDRQMRAYYNNGSGIKPGSAVPTSAFVENMFPGLANVYFPGSATSNYYYGIFNANSGSTLDNLHQLDRLTSVNGKSFPNCVSVTGCFTFFAPQSSTDPTWFNAGNASYNALVATVRRPLSRGFGFDLNYTWSHTIDNSSASSSNAGGSGAVLQNPFLPNQSRGDSAYDLRHQLNANFIVELPFGHNRKYASGAPLWLDTFIGGWQLSSLVRVQSGLPTSIGGNGVFNTNYYQSSLAVPIGSSFVETGGVKTDQRGNPGLFASTTDALSQLQDAYTGDSGSRSLVRMPWQRNIDMAVQKSFRLPAPGEFQHALTFRAEAFNLFNFVNYTTVTSLALSSPTTFGEFATAADARVLQLALRYTF